MCETVYSFPDRDKRGYCVKCGNHPVHCLCGVPEPKPKRWTLEELREQVNGFADEQGWFNGDSVVDFITWLGEQ